MRETCENKPTSSHILVLAIDTSARKVVSRAHMAEIGGYVSIWFLNHPELAWKQGQIQRGGPGGPD